MAKFCHSALREKGPVYKIIRQDKDGITVNYTNIGDAVLVCFALKSCKVRYAMRKLTDEESERYYAERAMVDAGEGI